MMLIRNESNMPRGVLLVAVFVGLASSMASAATRRSFEADVRPILKAHCFHCRVVVQDETLVLHDWDAAFGSDLSKAKTAGTLVATQDGDGVLRLSGDFDGARIEAVCDRVQPQEFLLINRGFHWVNEKPFNR